MKWNEAVFRAIGEIDDDLIPPEGQPAGQPVGQQAAEKANPHPLRKRIRAWSAAAVFLLILVGFWAFTPVIPTEKQPDDAAEKRADPLLRYPAILYTPVEAAEVWNSTEYYPLSFDEDLPAAPQIQTETAPSPSRFTDLGGRQFEVVTAYGGAESGTARRQLEIDLMYANYTRSYGCVLREAEWVVKPARMNYIGVCPLIREEDARAELLAGKYITSVPDELTAGGIREEQIARTELVYLISPDEDLIPMYYCYSVRLAEEGEERYGLFYVLAVDREVAERMAKEAKYER